MNIKADVLIVTVNEHETGAVINAFEDISGMKAEAIQKDGRVYRYLGTINGAKVYHALSEMGSGGVGATQQTVEKGIKALNPDSVIAVGIAFGVNDEKQNIGDILISKQLQLYDMQRVGDEIVLRGDKPHASTKLINYFEGVSQIGWEGVKVRPGIILSGDKLVDNHDYREQLKEFSKEAIGGEMEGAGLYVASNENKVDWIVIKAICDWGDGHKSKNKDARQKKAAKNAAGFVSHAISTVPLVDSSDDSNSENYSATETNNNPPKTFIDRVSPLIEELSSCIHEHRLMMSSHCAAILNKMTLSDDSYEKTRLRIDKKIVNIMPTIMMYVPVELRGVIMRIRRIVSNSWLEPKDIYYVILEAGSCFPRGPVDAAIQMYNDLCDCYTEMIYLLMTDDGDGSRFKLCLDEHSIDTNAHTTRVGANYKVANSWILEYEYSSASARHEALEQYEKECKSE